MTSFRTWDNIVLMSSPASWLLELVAVAEASVEMSDLLAFDGGSAFEIGLVVSGRLTGFAAPPARVSEGSRANAWLEGSDATFQQIVEGSLTPQQAFLSGLLTCRGNPETLLRFTALLEACAGSRRQ